MVELVVTSSREEDSAVKQLNWNKMVESVVTLSPPTIRERMNGFKIEKIFEFVAT